MAASSRSVIGGRSFTRRTASLDAEQVRVQRLAAVRGPRPGRRPWCSASQPSIAAVVAAVGAGAGDDRDQLAIVVDQSGRAAPIEASTGVTRRRRRSPSPRTMPIQSPATIGRLAVRVADRLRDLAGRDRCRSPRSISAAFSSAVCLGVVHDQRGQRLGHRPRRHDDDGLGRQRIDLLGDGDDVLVVRQDHDLRRR